MNTEKISNHFTLTESHRFKDTDFKMKNVTANFLVKVDHLWGSNVHMQKMRRISWNFNSDLSSKTAVFY